jgi:predicted phosphodiesterase
MAKRTKPIPVQVVTGIFDVHIPSHDRNVWAAWLAWCRDNAPDVVVLGGDLMDMESMSTHGGNPTPPTLADELRPARAALKEVRAANPHARIVYIEGNHETRLSRWIANNAKNLHGVVDLPSLLGLESLSIEWRPEAGKPLKLGKLRFIHGFAATDAHAKKHLMDYGSSVTYGHTHRPQVYTRGLIDGGVHGAFGMPCACELDAPYLHGRPSGWMQGWGVYYIRASGCFHVYPVLMSKGVAVCPKGKLYGKEVADAA